MERSQRAVHFWGISLLILGGLFSLPFFGGPLSGRPVTVAAPTVTQVTLYASADTYVDIGDPTGNYGNSTTIDVGRCYEFTTAEIGFIYFNLATIPTNAIIHSAELRLYRLSGGSPLTARVGVHRVTAPWQENTVTWNTRPGYVSTPVDTIAIGGTTNVFYTWEVTSLVQQWVNGSVSNYGLAVVVDPDTIDCRRFASREQAAAYRPRLVVSYTPTTPTPVPGMRSLRLDGNGDYVEVPFADDLNNFNALTIEAWVKRDAYRCETVVGNGWTKSYWLGFCTGPIRFYHTGYTRVDGNTLIPPGEWTHIAVTYDGVTRRYYVNGRLDLETTENNGPITGNPLQVFLGIGGDYDGGYYFKGLIDEVRIWNVVRTQAQIQANMFEVIDGPKPGLVAVWHFDGDARDAAGDHDGILRGGAWFSPEGFPSAPTPTPTPTVPTPTPTPTPALGSIQGVVYYDANYNGRYDLGVDSGIPNVRVELRQGDVVVASQRTSLGPYRFENLPPGTYVVDVDDTTIPWNYTWNTGNDPATVVLGPGENRGGVNFGYARPPQKWVYVEVNQAVQTAIFPVPPPGEGRLEASPVPLLPGKTTVVRFYLLANWEAQLRTTSDVALRLDVRARGGRGWTYYIRPNTDGPSLISVPRMPSDPAARDDLLRRMRADLERTLNFVISSDKIPLDATEISLSLENITLDLLDMGRTGGVTLRLSSPRTLGLVLVPLDIVEEQSSGFPLPTRARIEENVLSYLRVAYPINGILVRWQPTFVLDGANWLGTLFGVYGDELPVPGSDWSTILGIGRLPYGGGRGWQPGQAAVGGLSGNVPAQEVGHNLGLAHIRSPHNPPDTEVTPYEHGAIGELDLDASPHEVAPPPWGNVGIAARREPDGTWKVVLVDPGDPDKETPGDGDHAHEFMSYGDPRPGSPLHEIFTIQGANGEWLSDVIYKRIYDRMAPTATRGRHPGANADADKGVAGQAGTAGQDELRDAFIFMARAKEGRFQDLMLVRKSVSLARLQADEERNGPFTLQLLDGQGNVLISRSFALFQTAGSQLGGGESVALTVPYVEGVQRMVVRRNGRLVAERKASPNPPQVRVIGPNGGETFPSGVMTVKWDVDDPDGEPVDVLVEYTPDGGRTWQPLAFVASDLGEIQVKVEELRPGALGAIRVAASDGVNTVEDRSDGFFSVGEGGEISTIYLPVLQR